MKAVRLFFFGVLGIIVISFFLPNVFLPTDILHFFPSFHLHNFTPPKNSLLADPIYQFEPWRSFIKQSFLHLQIPLWNNYNGQGSPFFANPQTTVLFPLTILYILLPTSVALYAIPMLKIFLFFFFCFLYFRKIGASFSISIIGGFILSFSGFFILWLLWPHTNVFLFLPLFLFLVEKVRKSKRNYFHYFLISIAYALAIFGGHPETLFYITLLSAFYALYRLFSQFSKLLYTGLFVCLGILLGAVQLIPFAEYLIQSATFAGRTSGPAFSTLPVFSFIGNVFPFFLGAPHLNFYKQLSPNVNFQEITGGYVGLIVLLTAIVGVIKYWKKPFFIFWGVVVITSFMIAYGIFPFSYISHVPLIRSLANNRFVGIGAFGEVALFVLTLQELQRESRIKHVFIPFVGKYLSFFLLLLTGLYFGLFFYPLKLQNKMEHFMIFFSQHVLLVLLTTTFFAFLMQYLLLKKIFSGKYLYLLFLPIFFQTLFFFWNYNPVTKTSDYFPQTELIKKLQTMPKGIYLNIGNPAIPANINVMYNLQNAENNDAIEINWYKKAFDTAFSIKNQWGVVDSLAKVNAQKFNITYVLSDYNLNYIKNELQPVHSKILGPLIKGRVLKIPFTPTESNLAEIRILPANYNRENSCILHITITRLDDGQKSIDKIIPCNMLSDNMFYTLDLTGIELNIGSPYTISFESSSRNALNAIGLWGNSKSQPFVTLFFDSKANEDFVFLGKFNNTQLWKVPDVSQISLNGSYKILADENQKFSFVYDSKLNQAAEIKKTYFPGWNATVDGNPVKVLNGNPFITLKLPTGLHIVTLFYKPLSFFLSSIISILTGVVLFIFIFRNGTKEKWFNNFLKNWNTWANKKNKISLYKHIVIIVFAIIVALFLYIAMMHSLSLRFSISNTLTINWLTVHGYPREQDYFYFYTALPFVTIFTCLAWFIWIRIKK